MVEFQDVILKLSEHTKNREGVDFDENEALALLEGFHELTQTLGSQHEAIDLLEEQVEELESKLSKKRKLWRPSA